MSDLHETATFSDIRHIAKAKVTCFEGDIGTVLEDFVSLVASKLVLLVPFLEVEGFP